MNCGYTNNGCNNNYYCGNDCDCPTAYDNNVCDVTETVCNSCGSRRGSDCGVLLFIIAVILIFCR